MSNRPTVLVVEMPEADPEVFAPNGIDVEYVSAYLATDWAVDDVRAGVYDDIDGGPPTYPADMRELAAEFASVGMTDAASTLLRLARQFEETHADYLAARAEGNDK